MCPFVSQSPALSVCRPMTMKLPTKGVHNNEIKSSFAVVMNMNGLINAMLLKAIEVVGGAETAYYSFYAYDADAGRGTFV